MKPMINYENTKNMFKNSTRKQARSFTVASETDVKWREFVETLSDSEIRQGNGIGSVMVEFAMKLTMTIFTGVPMGEVAECVKQMVAPEDMQKLRDNLRLLHNELKVD